MSGSLEEDRRSIREVDDEILRLIKRRLELAEKIGKKKKEQDLSTVDLRVEKNVIKEALRLGKELGLNEEFTGKVMNLLISEALRAQGRLTQGRSGYLYGMFEKVQELESQGEKVVKLNVGEPDFQCLPTVKAAAREALGEEKDVKYVSAAGIKELRESIASMIRQKHGLKINPNQVFVTLGGKFAVFAGVLASVSESSRVLLIEPYWPVYEECALVAKTRIDYVHTVLEEDWNIDLQKIKEAFDAGTKLMILCNPSNPTGKIIPKEELEKIVELANKRNVTILSDEVYDAYAFSPFTSILGTSCDNFIYVNSFSKKYGMTGWRVGYAISSPQTILRMQKIMQISATCVPEFVQMAALKALTIDEKTVATFSETMRRRVGIACDTLRGLPLGFKKPDGGMYIFPEAKCEDFNSNDFALKLLSTQKVAVAPGEAFGDYPRCFRISLGTSEENIKIGIERIGKMLEKWKG